MWHILIDLCVDLQKEDEYAKINLHVLCFVGTHGSRRSKNWFHWLSVCFYIESFNYFNCYASLCNKGVFC